MISPQNAINQIKITMKLLYLNKNNKIKYTHNIMGLLLASAAVSASLGQVMGESIEPDSGALPYVAEGGLIQEEVVTDEELPYVNDVELEESYWNRFGFGVQAGTQGIGPALTYDIFDWLYVKAEANFFSFSVEDSEIEDITYDGDLDLTSFGVSLTARPFYRTPILRGFKASLGVFSVDNTLSVAAVQPDGSLSIGDSEVTLGANDRVLAGASFEGVAPYVGIGWDINFGENKGLTFSVDAGVFITGSPETSFGVESDDLDALAASGGITVDQLNNEILTEADEISDVADEIPVYPVVRIGLSYRF